MLIFDELSCKFLVAVADVHFKMNNTPTDKQPSIAVVGSSFCSPGGVIGCSIFPSHIPFFAFFFALIQTK